MVVKRRFVPGAAIDERLAEIDATIGASLVTDRQNSVLAVLDAQGNPVVRRGYGAYGGLADTPDDPAQMTGAGGASHPLGYTGRRWGPAYTPDDLQLYHDRARWYDPQLGTFLQTGPIGAKDYINLYSYLGLSPGNAADPSGESSLAGQGLGLLLTDWLLKRELRGITNLDERRRIAQRCQSTFDFCGAAPDAASRIERDTRPTALRVPNTINRTQSDISNNLSDGREVDETVRGLRSGSIRPEDIPPIRVLRGEDGRMYTLDHRRLVAAIEAGVQVNTLELAIQDARAEPGQTGQRARSAGQRPSGPPPRRPRPKGKGN